MVSLGANRPKKKVCIVAAFDISLTLTSPSFNAIAFYLDIAGGSTLRLRVFHLASLTWRALTDMLAKEGL